jgi:hypothetical protein
MTFLAPALLVGLATVVIPILVHLVQRERRRTVAFPSLMFLRKIPYKSTRRRAIRHWPLLLLRALAFTLIALAFARPLVPGAARATAGGNAREVVILLDRSYSMGYGNHWERARGAARDAVQALGPSDRGTVAFFATDVEVGPRSAADRGALLSAIDRATPGAAATRYAPALRAAAGLLGSSNLPRRRIVLISDFQKTGWDRSQDVRLPPGVELVPVSIAETPTADAGVVGLSLDRRPEAGRELITASVRLVNRSQQPAPNLEVALEVDGHRIDSRRVFIAPEATATVTFAPFTLAGGHARITARLKADALTADDAFYAVASQGERVPVLILEDPVPALDSSLYMVRALSVGGTPGFDTRVIAANRVTPADVSAARVVVLIDTPPPTGAAGRALDARVREGGGLLVALGDRSAWPAGSPDLLPGVLGSSADRAGTLGGTLGFVDYSHPVFEIFSRPHSGDLTAARVFRYRRLAPATTDSVLARFDDGAVALAERRTGKGHVLAWTSTLDSYWNDLALKPVFLPFVHQTMRYLGRYVEAKLSYTVGDVFNPDSMPQTDGVRNDTQREVLAAITPGGRAVETGEGRLGSFPLTEPGFYEIRSSADRTGVPTAIAVNVAAEESDLSPLDPAELVAAVTAPGTEGRQGSESDVTAAEQERQQGLWWYLLVAGLLLLVLEAVVAGRLPRMA